MMSSPRVRGLPGGRVLALCWAVEDGIVLTWRNVITIPRVLELLVFAAVQPVMFVLLFAFVFGSAIALPGGGSHREFLLPGIFAMTLAFGSTRTALGLAEDMQKGLVDRFRSLPISRSAVLVGRTTADLLVTALTLGVTGVVGWLVGWGIHAPGTDAALGFVVLLLFGYALSWVGAAIGLSVKTPEAATKAVLGWLFPLAFVSNAFVPPAGMPLWLQYIAEWNPVSAVVAACRQLWGNPQLTIVHHAWVTDYPVEASLLWSVVLLAVAMPLAVGRYRRAVIR